MFVRMMMRLHSSFPQDDVQKLLSVPHNTDIRSDFSKRGCSDGRYLNHLKRVIATCLSDVSTRVVAM